MAVRITSAESIRRAILADALLGAIFAKVEVNRTGLAPIALGASIGIQGIPQVEELEAIWRLKIIGLTDAETNDVAETLARLFPGSSFKFNKNDITVEIFSLVTREVLDSIDEQKKLLENDKRTKSLEQAIEYARGLRSGSDGVQGERGPQGVPGERGPMGPPGRDGRDVLATDAILDDLGDVFVPDPKVGHVLTWDGAGWVSRFVPQVYKYAGGGSAGGGIEDAPSDGNYYVRQNGSWIELSEALAAINLDAGNFDA